MNNLIFVVMHKKYKVPKFNPYKSIAVGFHKNGLNTYYRDDLGDNIAFKNSTYCELTAQYWVWKHVSKNYTNIGLNHYRRYFGNSKLQFNLLLKNNRINKYLNYYDIILPEQWFWKLSVAENYYINGCGKKKDLITTRDAIRILFPKYLKSFDHIMNKHSASYCNMFVMNRNNFDRYSLWLFTILEYVEKNTDLTNYTVSEKRIYGYLSELLLNVWVNKNNLKVKYLPMIEKELTFGSTIKRKLQFCSRKYMLGNNYVK